MFDPKQFDDIAKTLFSILPASVQSIEKEIQQQFKDALQSAFARMQLITREEFDVERKVLSRTRDRLDRLQAQVDAFIVSPKE
jgi:BMFP domain-containing protein YqiC